MRATLCVTALLLFTVCVECFPGPVAIDGGWTDWKPHCCSVSCGEGQRTLTRTCSNPLPQNGGNKCQGNEEKTEICFTIPCPPINGGWTEWQISGECSKTCGGGIQKSTRTCTNPKPQFGGNNCTGLNWKTESCNTAACPQINGGWTDWQISGECSKTCGGGIQKSTRTCTNPKPQFGGNDCTGLNWKTESCKTAACPPIDGGWTEWQISGECSKTCGGGVQKSTRSCTNPKPQFAGNDCTGLKTKTDICNVFACPVPCEAAIDLAVVLDASASVRRRNFKNAKKFVTGMARNMNLNWENGTRMGLIVFSMSPEVLLTFQEKNREKQNADGVEELLKPIRLSFGTRTDLALKMAGEQLFTEQDDREDKPNVLILIADGQTGRNSKPYPTVLQPLADKNVTIFSVGVGKKIRVSELEEIAGAESRVFKVDNFDSLLSILSRIVTSSCV